MPKVRCNTSFFDIPTGYVFPVGTQVDAASPVVARHPHLFDSAPVVEQATAAPGEVRETAPRKTRAAKKPK